MRPRLYFGLLAGFACERLRFFSPVVRKISDFVALHGEDQRPPNERPRFRGKSTHCSTAAAPERTFESAEELPTNYLEGVDPKGPMIAYYRIPGMHQIVD
jgi:hypothetical protein